MEVAAFLQEALLRKKSETAALYPKPVASVVMVEALDFAEIARSASAAAASAEIAAVPVEIAASSVRTVTAVEVWAMAGAQAAAAVAAPHSAKELPCLPWVTPCQAVMAEKQRQQLENQHY